MQKTKTITTLCDQLSLNLWANPCTQLLYVQVTTHWLTLPTSLQDCLHLWAPAGIIIFCGCLVFITPLFVRAG